MSTEYFGSRGIGMEWNLCCFVCGMEEKLLPNISGFVETKESGEAVVKMFGDKCASLDFREHESKWIQVKIGACNAHVRNLEKLHELTRADRTISPDIIASAKQ